MDQLALERKFFSGESGSLLLELKKIQLLTCCQRPRWRHHHFNLMPPRWSSAMEVTIKLKLFYNDLGVNSISGIRATRRHLYILYCNTKKEILT